MRASWYGRNGLVTIRDFGVRAGYELSQDTVDRLGILYARPCAMSYLGALECLGVRPMPTWRAASSRPGSCAEQAREPLIAVLAEAGRPQHQDSPDWAALLARGLALLPATARRTVTRPRCPASFPPACARAMTLITGQAAHASTERGSVPAGDTLFVVLDPRGTGHLRAGRPARPIVFAPGPGSVSSIRRLRRDR